MFCVIHSPARRRLIRSSWIGAVLLVLLAVGVAESFRFWHLKGLPAYVVAVLPSLPILWFIVEMGRFLAAEKDEFQRNLLVQCLLWGTGGTLAMTTVWGYLEDYAHAPHLNLIFVFPLFCLFMAVAKFLVQLRYR
jgi:hypothetical protein